MIDRHKKRAEPLSHSTRDNVAHTVKRARPETKHPEIQGMIERANAEMNSTGPEWKD